jgi:virulence factor Mce-like protein
MRGGSSASAVYANPVLVGALTTLIVVVGVFLAYNANQGLPFVPTTQIDIEVGNGANLVAGNEVREGGYRIGQVDEMVPRTISDGSVGAVVRLKLDKAAGEIPEDTRFTVRPRSALGLKYLEMERGGSERMLEDGDTVEVGQSTVPVDLDDVFNMFDAETRRASRENLRGFGNALAFRGPDINRAIGELPPLFGHLESVMRNLAAPETELERFFQELGDAARIVAPVSRRQAQLFTYMADTFEAIARDPEALKETISRTPPTLDVAVDSFRTQRPFLRDTAAFSRELRGAARDLRVALPVINPALEQGVPVLRRSPALNEELRKTMVALLELTSDPATDAALRALTATVVTLNPQLRFLGPYVTVCNYWNYFWTFVAEHISEPDRTGQAQRVLLNSSPQQRNSIGSMGAPEPANGEDVVKGPPVHLHGQAYGAAVDDRGNADCENGQRGYLEVLRGEFPDHLDIVVEPNTPGNQGPTFRRFRNGEPEGLGRSRVPAGQTFTRRPETGAQIP